MISQKQWLSIEKTICNATRRELDEILERVEKEIRLSDTAIAEGEEVDDRVYELQEE